MKVRLLKSVAGTWPDGDGYAYNIGDVADFDKKTAKGFLNADDPIAEPVAVKPVSRAKKAIFGKGKESR